MKLLFKISGEEIVSAFKEVWLDSFGKPEYFLSDQGRQYVSVALQKYLQSLQIKQRFAAIYNPTCNSITERTNQQIGNVLRVMRGRPIQEVMNTLDRALNYQINRTTGWAPIEILLRRNPLDPVQRTIAIDNTSIRQRIESTASAEIEKRNKHRSQQQTPQVGDRVYTRCFLRSKLEPFWDGPHTIINSTSSGQTFQINFGNKTQWLNIKDLKAASKLPSRRRQGVVPATQLTRERQTVTK